MAGFGVQLPVDLDDDILDADRQRLEIIEQEQDIINEEKRERAMKIQAVAASDPTAEIKEETRNLFHDRLLMDGFNPSIFDNMLKISGAIVAGGYPLQVFSKESWPSDIDLWIPSPNSGGHVEHIYRYLMDLGYTPRRMSLRCSNVRSANVNMQTCEMDYIRFNRTVNYIVAFYKPDAIVVQVIVLRNNLNPVDMVKTFDLDVCQVMYMNGAISFTEQGLSEKILTKRASISQAALNLQSTYEWFRTFKRIDKYMMRGYTVDIVAMLKVLSVQIPNTIHSINTLDGRENFIWTWNRNATFNLMATLRMPLFVPTSRITFIFGYVNGDIPADFAKYPLQLKPENITEVIATISIRTLTYTIINLQMFNKLEQINLNNLFGLDVPVKEFNCNLPVRPLLRDWNLRPVYIQGIDVCLTVGDILKPAKYISLLDEYSFYEKSPRATAVFNKFFFDIKSNLYFQLSKEYSIPIDSYLIMFKALTYNFNQFVAKPDKSIEGLDGSEARFHVLGKDETPRVTKVCTCSLIKNAVEPTSENVSKIMEEMLYYRPRFMKYVNKGDDNKGDNGEVLPVWRSEIFDPNDKNIFIYFRSVGIQANVVVSQIALTPYLKYDTAVDNMWFPSHQDIGIVTQFPLVMLPVLSSSIEEEDNESLLFCFSLLDIYKLINMPEGTGCAVIDKTPVKMVKADGLNNIPFNQSVCKIGYKGFDISSKVQKELIEAAKAMRDE